MRQSWGWVGSLTLVALSSPACAGKVTPAEQGNTGGSKSSPPASASAGRSSLMDPGKPIIMGAAGSSNSSGTGTGGMAPAVSGVPPQAGAAPHAGGENAGAGGQGVIIVPPVDGVAGMGDCDPGDFLKLPPNCGQVPLTPTNGWIDGQNAAHIQGAVFAFADATSALGMSMDFTGANACIQGTAAKVDMASEACLNHTFTPPATDCYGEYWGAAIGMNLNQTIDPTTMMGNTPAPFDASALQGFSFELTGNVLPGPNALRFVVENEDKQFCNPSSVKLRAGSNTVLFSELFSRCFTTTDPPQPSAETVKSALIRISWQVVTNSSSTTPFDFCVSNVRALPR